jgi:hypothetical protein
VYRSNKEGVRECVLWQGGEGSRCSRECIQVTRYRTIYGRDKLFMLIGVAMQKSNERDCCIATGGKNQNQFATFVCVCAFATNKSGVGATDSSVPHGTEPAPGILDPESSYRIRAIAR